MDDVVQEGDDPKERRVHFNFGGGDFGVGKVIRDGIFGVRNEVREAFF